MIETILYIKVLLNKKEKKETTHIILHAWTFYSSKK
jgi:hypothetical protein